MLLMKIIEIVLIILLFLAVSGNFLKDVCSKQNHNTIQKHEVNANYEVISKELVPLIKGDTECINFDNLKMTKKSREEGQKLYGLMILHKPWTHQREVVVELYVQQGYEYRKTPYNVKKNVCELIEMTPFMDSFLEKTGMKKPVSITYNLRELFN